MKKYINNKVYDTSTAKKIGDHENNCLPGDIYYHRERLYRKKTGEFFLWANGSFSDDDVITPLSAEEAESWAQEHLDADEYDEIFGEITEDETQEMMAFRLKASNAERLRRAMTKTGKTAAQIVDELIENAL